MVKKQMYLCIATILFVLIFASCQSQNKPADKEAARDLKEYYVGSIHSDKFHTIDCKWAKNIKPENEVYYTYEEAIKANYKPCKTCNPQPE